MEVTKHPRTMGYIKRSNIRICGIKDGTEIKIKGTKIYSMKL